MEELKNEIFEYFSQIAKKEIPIWKIRENFHANDFVSAVISQKPSRFESEKRPTYAAEFGLRPFVFVPTARIWERSSQIGNLVIRENLKSGLITILFLEKKLNEA